MYLPTHPEKAKEHMPFLGRLMVRKRYGDFWEEETRTLPWTMRSLRRRYRAFADQFIRPRALEVDKDVSALDKEALFREYASRGWATELLPRPVGRMKLACIRNYGMHTALKMEELCAACGGIALMLGAHDLGVAPLLLCGHLRTHIRWTMPLYRRINKGENLIMAFAITEPGAGSDVEETEGAMKARLVTRARRTDGGYRISGRKVFISDGGIARYVTLFSCLEDEGAESWTCFVIERGMEGFSLGRQEKKMGQKAGDATELILEDVLVPERNRVGPERSGWALNRVVLNLSRPIVGAIALGTGRGAFEHCLEFCRNTRLGNKPLVHFQEVQLALAEMMIQLWAARSLIWQGIMRFMPPLPAASSASKIFASDTAVRVSEMAMDLMGDHAYMHGRGVEKALRDARLTQIYEGTNQINRLQVIEDLWESDVARGVE